MNIVITLPHELIQAILDGRKTVEVRSRIPKDFRIERDVVYVVEKGTTKCPLCFSIRAFEEFYDYDNAFMAAKDKTCVPERWLSDYLHNCYNPVLWHIGRVCPIADDVYSWMWLGLYRNPQCFRYSDYDVTYVTMLNCFWSKDITKAEKETVFCPDKYREYLYKFAEAGASMPWEEYCELYKIPQNCRGIQL